MTYCTECSYHEGRCWCEDPKEQLTKLNQMKCNCGKKATREVGLADPDATKFPKCDDCAEKWKLECMIELSKIDFSS